MSLIIWIALLFAAGWFAGWIIDNKTGSVSHEQYKPEQSPSLPDYDNSYTGKGYQPYISHDDYKAYLNSLSWKTKAYQRVVIDKYTCQYCGSEVRSMDGDNHTPNVHHLHYRTLQVEDVNTDIVTLCKLCHHELHAKYSLPEMEEVINFQRTRLALSI